MKPNILEALRRIREGVLLEAEDDKYDIPASGDDDPTPDTDPVNANNVNNDDDGSGNEPDDESSSNYELDSGGGDEEPSDDETEGDAEVQEDETQQNQPKPGEIIPLDATSRKILIFKNFRKYRLLRDSVDIFVNELSEIPTSSDESRKIISLCIEKANQLLEKLNDYIVYRYQNNSYEVNYRNFTSFVLEKRLIEQILKQIDQNT